MIYILFEIFKFLDVRELIICSMVNKDWYSVSHNKIFWKNIIIKEIGEDIINYIHQFNIEAYKYLYYIKKLINDTQLNYTITELIYTRIIDLSYKLISFQEIPKGLYYLINIKILLLQHNNIIKVPDNIKYNHYIQYIDLRHNNLTHIPDALCKLKFLQSLYLSNNLITDINLSAKDIKMENLLTLHLGNNKLTNFDNLCQLKNLRTMIINNNNITYIPNNIYQLINLEVLNLSDNLIEKIPKNIKRIINLTYLDLSNNKIKNIPNELYKLYNLSQFCISGNIIENMDNIKQKFEHFISIY